MHLPAKNVQNALNRLMDLERERHSGGREPSIDLRLPDRILLRPMGETRARHRHGPNGRSARDPSCKT